MSFHIRVTRAIFHWMIGKDHYTIITFKRTITCTQTTHSTMLFYLWYNLGDYSALGHDTNV